MAFSNPSFSSEDSLKLNGLIDELKENGQPMHNCMIFIYNPEEMHYIFMGNDPFRIDIDVKLYLKTKHKVF